MPIRITLASLLFFFASASSTAKPDAKEAPKAVPEQQPVVAVRNPYEGGFKEEYLSKIKMPEGFSIEVFADDVPGARSMALGESGTLFVGTRGKRSSPQRLGDVYAIPFNQESYKADSALVIASELYMPNGVAFKEGALFVAEPNRLLKYADIESELENVSEPTVLNDEYPSDRHHGWKYIAFGPDERIYLPVGAPCNICETDDTYSVITSLTAEGKDKQVVARGVRNTVGFDWHPVTNELWFTDNGRDLWSDDMPPEELNRVAVPGEHFGFPYEYGKGHRDNVFPTDRDDFTDAALELPAHTAPLGMKFYTGEMFPEKYRNQILIPHHGSWNRSIPDGYYISFVELDGNVAKEMQIFASGWLQGERNWGRPTDLLELPDGSLLVSDDQAGVIYRITYSEPSSAAE